MPPPLDPRAALFLDIDGTLLEIARGPDAVRVPSALPSLLRDLATRRGGALALVSGRSLAAIDRLFDPWRGAAAGLHGSERRRADGSLDRRANPAAASLDRVRPRLAAWAGGERGLVFEDKGETLALHYRAAPEREPQIRRFAAAIARREPQLRAICGKMVVEFQPRGIDKGRAIAAFMAEPPFAGRPAVFVGDDATDEDGFAEISRRRGIAVRVGPPAPSRSRYRLADVRAVHRWLAAALTRPSNASEH